MWLTSTITKNKCLSDEKAASAASQIFLLHLAVLVLACGTMFEDVVCSEVHHDQLYQSYIDSDVFGDSGNNDTVEDSRK